MNAFTHQQSAHCESGVVSALLTHGGLALSEPMVFGLASALAFAYIPFVKLAGMPLIAYRMPPGWIIRGIQKRLGVKIHRQKFNDAIRGMQTLDNRLAAGNIVGLQTSVYWLPYFPSEMRFHFNAHNLIVFGKEHSEYLISDPIFETTARCDTESLQKARFAKGALAPKGAMYYLESVPAEIDFSKIIPAAIRANLRTMTKAPLPVIGIRGIRYLAKNVVSLARANDNRHLTLYLAHIVRMQEEIGTGGAGFRFIYASFLQESARLLQAPVLQEASTALTEAGDQWRMFALRASKMCRNREAMNVHALSELLNSCADMEKQVWDKLRDV